MYHELYEWSPIRTEAYVATLKRGIENLGPDFNARVCGRCDGMGRVRAMFTAGCGGGYYVGSEDCDSCGSTGLCQGDSQAPISVLNQVLEASRQPAEWSDSEDDDAAPTAKAEAEAEDNEVEEDRCHETYEISIPADGSMWKHRNGLEFQVIMVVNEPGTPTYPMTVVYKGVHNGKRWARPLSTWHGSMTKINPGDAQ